MPNDPRTHLDRNFLFDLENDTIVCASRLIATLRNDLSIGALPAVWLSARARQDRTILRPVFTILLLAQPSGKSDSTAELTIIYLSRRYREQSDPARHRPEPPPCQMSFRQQQQKNRSKRGKRGSDVGKIAESKGNSGVEARGEEQSGPAETTGDDRDGNPRQIDAKGGNWVYNANRLGIQKGNPSVFGPALAQSRAPRTHAELV